MNILLVINNLGSGGAQNQLTYLALGLQSRGHEVTVFTYHPQDFFGYRLKGANIKRVKAKKTDKVGINVVKGLIDSIKELSIDIVISYLRTPNFYAAIASKFTRVAFIPSYRSMTEFDTLKYPIRKSMEWVNKQASQIVANSQHEKNRWIVKYPNLVSKFATISNVVVLGSVSAGQSKSSPIRFLVVGSVSPFKNGLNIIEALKQVKAKSIQFHLKWIGRTVYDYNDHYFQRMKKALGAADLSDNWTWQEPTSEIAKEYEDCDYLLHASIKEGFPNVVCEALAHSRPCVVSNVLDHPNIIEERKNGFLFDPNSAEDIANKLIEAFTMSNEQYNKMCEYARKTAEAKFSKDVFLDAYERVIHSVSLGK